MASTELKEQILKAIYRKIGRSPTKNALIWDIKVGFDHIDKDIFFDAVKEMMDEKLIADRHHGYVALMPDGWEKAENLMNPPPTVNQNTLNIGHAQNSPIQQGIHSHQEQSSVYAIPSSDKLQELVELMNAHLGELKLSPENERKAKAQLATIQAQLLDTPNPTIIKEAGRSLKSITEGVVAGLIATAAQPGVWAGIHSLLALF